MNHSIVRRLATSQSRGVNQTSYLNELLAFEPVPYRFEEMPAYMYGRQMVSRNYGDTRLPFRSFVSLRERLVSTGFVLVDDREKQTITLKFPELKEES